MRYRVIILDADRTLFDFDQSEEIAFKKLLSHFGLEKEFSNLFSLYMKKNEETWAELEKGLLTQSTLKIERFQRFINAAKLTGEPKAFSEVFTMHLADASILYDDAYEVVEELSKICRLVIVTNGLKEVQHKRIRHSILKPFIETTIVSDEINIMKPDPSIIDYTLKKLNHTQKDDVLIVGDSLTSDIQCGINAGIDTVWYNPNGLEHSLDLEPTYTIKTLNELLNIVSH